MADLSLVVGAAVYVAGMVTARVLRYTATVRPGASASEIRMSYSGGALEAARC